MQRNRLVKDFEELAPNELLELVDRRMAELDAPASVDGLADELAELIATLELGSVGLASVLAVRLGALLEGGADADVVAPRFVAKLGEFIPTLAEDYLAVRAEQHDQADDGDGDGDDEEAQLREFLTQVLGNYELATAALLSRSRVGRDRVADEPDLLRATVELRWDFRFLHHVTHVLDDELLLVLHPGEGWGYRVRIAGVSDNWQLHILLADALHEAHPSPSWTRPGAEAVAVMRGRAEPNEGRADGVWDMVLWTAAPLSDGPPRPTHWIWGEGVPADIMTCPVLSPPRRVILLAPPTYERSTNLVRDFEALQAEVEVVEAVSGEELHALLVAFAEFGEAAKRELLERHADEVCVSLSE